jgi:hypothetical protein
MAGWRQLQALSLAARLYQVFRNTVPLGPRTEPVPLDAAKDGAHIEVIVLVVPAGKVHVTVPCRSVKGIRHDVYEAFGGHVRVERNLIVWQPFGRLGNRPLRPVDDETGCLGVKSRFRRTCSQAAPHLNIR